MIIDAAGVTVVCGGWQVGVCVCQGGDWAMPAAAAGPGLHCQCSLAPGVSAATCEPRPATATQCQP